MMRFSIYAILLLVFGLLFGNGLQAQQLQLPSGESVEALVLPQWQAPTGNTDDPLRAVRKKLDVNYQIPANLLEQYRDADQVSDYNSIEKFLQKKRVSAGTVDLSKDFDELEIVDTGEYGTPPENGGTLPFNPSVYYSVQILIRTSSGAFTSCTGILIGAQTILTTGACLFDETLFGGDGFAQEIFVIPGADSRVREDNGLLEYTFTVAESVEVAAGWQEDQNFDFNLGLINMARPLGGVVALYEADNGVYMGYDTQGTSRFRAFTHRNDGYPIAEGFEPETQYTRQGRFDDTGNEITSTDDDSPDGMQGSPAYRPATGSSITAYAVLSNAAEGGGTDYVRITSDKEEFIDDFVDSNLPDVTDLVFLNQPVNFVPDTVSAGEVVGTEDDIYAVGVYNHSTVDYSGPVFWAAFIIPEGGTVNDAIFLSENALGFPEIDIPAGTFTGGNVSGGFTIPAGTPGGQYFLGAILVGAEDGIQENNNTVAPGDLIPITILGGSASLSVDPTELTVGAEAGSVTFDVTASLDWTASTDADWLSLDPETGSADATVTVNYQANASTMDSRTATITVAAADGSVDPVTVTITQEELTNFIMVSMDTIRVGGEAGTTSFSIETDLLWSIEENADWLSVNPESGFENADVDVSFDANPSEMERVATLSITTSEDASAEVVVIQDGSAIMEMISIDPTAASVDAAAGEIVAQLSSNASWTGSADADWVSFAPATGTGDAAITVKFEENMSTSSRQATLTFTTGAGATATHVLTQGGAAANIIVEPAALSVGFEEGDASVSVTANEAWTASSDADWVVITPDAGPGSGDVTIGYLENTDLASRGATITFTTTSGASTTIAITQDGRPRVTVVDIVVGSDIHNTLEAAVIAAELADVLSGEGPFTVFAPTDDAFAALPEGTVETLLEDPTGDLAQILLYHVLGTQVLSTDLSDGLTATTLQGDDVTVTINDDGIFINDAEVIVADITTDNGVVHVIDAVLLPPPALPATVVDIIVESEIHNTLEAAVIAAELADDLSGEGPFTVFAPTDDAFAALPEGTVETLLEDPTGDLAQILLYHVLGTQVLSTDLSDGLTATTLQGDDVTVTINDDGIFINDAEVIVADILAENGVVHVIDAVLLPPPALPATVVDIIVESEIHNTLEAAVIAAELADDLSGEGPFTVFAPTDDAFAALPEGTVETLLEDPTGDLAQILLYHVLGTQVLSTDLSDGLTATTLQGDDVTVTINDDGIFINDAEVIVADILAENGVVHVIDAVLLPPPALPATVVDIIVESEIHNTLEAAVIAAELADDLSGEGPFTVFAPTDDAFAALPEGTVETLLEDPTGDLAQILLYHVLGTQVLSTDLSDGLTATTLQGDDVTVTINDDGIFINDAEVIVADILAENGVVHVIDAVLLPPTCEDKVGAGMVALEDGSTEATVTVGDGEDDILSFVSEGGFGENFTYVVTDDNNVILGIPPGNSQNFESAGPGICRVWGLFYTGNLTAMAGDNATEIDLSDDCFVLSSNFIAVTREEVVMLPETVVDIIVESEIHNTLEAAVIAAELADDLSGEGPFTVFAPTDDAFAALPEGTVETLLEDPTGDLAQILLYHVLGTQVLSTDLSDGLTATTLQGDDVTVTINDDGIFINDAEVIVADILAENGVVHVIDAVLLPPPALPATVVDIIVESEIHNTLEAAVIAAELADDLSGEGPFTVFAPTDDAFAALPEGTVETLLEDPTGDLAQILLYHVLGTQVLSTDLSDGLTATTLQGDDVTVTINDDGIFINDAEVIVADILAENGVVHVIDAVLLPPPALPATVVDIIVESEIHNTLEAAVIAAELADDLSGEGPFTVFAPTDDAFAALPEGTVETLLEDPTGDLAQILLYHVLGTQVLSTDLSDGLTATTLQGDDVTVTINDDGIFINDAEVIVADILAENGVVHVIDAVLLPPPALPATVVDIIVESEIHTTLEVGVIAAGLADDLSGEGPFTVFAPTDDAFAALPDGVLDSLLADPNDLGEVLLYHVLNARVLSTDLSDGQTATTLLGEDITVTIDADGNIFINDAQVITADILAENGVVHVIDAVLTPPAEVDCEDVVGGGTVALEDGTTEATVTVGDGIDDILSFTSSDAFGENFTYVVTDDNNVILGIPPGNSQNFEGAGPGVCRVWGLSYTGNLTAMAGDTASAIALSDDCFDLSDNFITVIREEADLPATVVDIIVNSPIHNTLEAAVIAAELADDLSGEGPFTVFAPTDDAFAALPEGVLDALLEGPTSDLANILLYHVLNARVLSSDLSDGQTATTLLGEDITVTIDADGNIFINDAQVTAADILADNGVVHVIDAVLLPPAPPTTVVDIIVNSDIHNTLEAAVIAAELADDLSGEGPFTVFAPTDDAFAALPEGTVETLLEDPTGDLAQILLYHVLGAEVLSTDLSDGLTATTLQGDDITVTINDDGIFINDAEVIVADLQADNGVVHVIDAVLLPTVTETTTVVDIIVNSDIHNTLEAAVIAAELADDLSGEGPFTVFAPTDDAFAALPEGTVETLLEDPTGDLAQILLYHVLGAEVLSSDLSDGQTATTLQGQDITVSIDTAGNIFINDAQVIVADIQADNGVVHVIDAVLLPELDDPSDRFLEIRPPSRVVDQNAGETVFVVFTNTTWSIDTEGLDNIQIFPSSGSGTAFIKVFYDENMEGPARTTVLDIVATTGETGTFTLTQAGTDDFIAATPDAIEVNAVEGSTSFELISNADWTVSTAADWITLSTADGSGNATIGVDYASNSAIEGRTATITAMTADGAMATVTVTQGASADVEVFFELRPPSLEVGSGSGEGQFVIFTNAIWGISTDADWVEFFGKEGEGTAFIKVFYDANDSSESRTAELNVVTSTGESGVFTLTQAGAGNFIITNPDFTSPDAFTMDMTLFPNPTTTELNIRVEASDDRSVDVQIIDTNGRIVKLFNSQAIFEGINTLQVPTADLTNGIYYFRMIGQDVVKEARFMVAK